MMPHQLSVIERRADHAGLARGELRHRVEQMREAAQAVAKRMLRDIGGGVGVTGADDDAGCVGVRSLEGTISGASVTSVSPADRRRKQCDLILRYGTRSLAAS